jgi:molecular chaperone Hsp33
MDAIPALVPERQLLRLPGESAVDEDLHDPYHIREMADHLLRALLADGSVRVIAAVTTDVAREAARRHRAVAGAAVALARGATSGLLLATLTKGGERVTLQVLGDGPLGGLTADATDAGDVRAYVKNAEALVPGGRERRAALHQAIGRHGVVNVVRDLGLREQYSGQSSLVTGEIDEDVEHYLRVSEQVESALGCEAVLGEGMVIAAAAGVLAQCMPGGAGVELVRDLQHQLRTGRLYDLLADGIDDAVDLVGALLGERAGELEVLETRAVRFHCPCSRERVEAMLELLGHEELSSMIRDDGRAEVFCNFCNERYEVSRRDLEAIRGRTEQHGTS